MDIQKQKEIIALGTEARGLWERSVEKRNEILDKQTEIYLTNASDELINFLEKENFKFDGSKEGLLTADSGDGIKISMSRKSSILTVNMPNLESYSIIVELTKTYPEEPGVPITYSQDAQINYFKKSIDSLKNYLNSIEESEARYVISIDPRDGNYRSQVKKTFIKFEDALKLMFS